MKRIWNVLGVASAAIVALGIFFDLFLLALPPAFHRVELVAGCFLIGRLLNKYFFQPMSAAMREQR